MFSLVASLYRLCDRKIGNRCPSYINTTFSRSSSCWIIANVHKFLRLRGFTLYLENYFATRPNLGSFSRGSLTSWLFWATWKRFHIYKTPTCVFLRRVRATAASRRAKDVIDRWRCITKLCKAPTCTINIFKSSRGTHAVRVRIYSGSTRATSVSRGARTINSYPLFLSEDMRVREPWKYAVRRRGIIQWSRDHLRYRTANRHLGNFDDTDEAMTTRSEYVLSSSLIINRVMKSLVSFAARKKTISGELWTWPFNSTLPIS